MLTSKSILGDLLCTKKQIYADMMPDTAVWGGTALHCASWHAFVTQNPTWRWQSSVLDLYSLMQLYFQLRNYLGHLLCCKQFRSLGDGSAPELASQRRMCCCQKVGCSAGQGPRNLLAQLSICIQELSIFVEHTSRTTDRLYLWRSALSFWFYR